MRNHIFRNKSLYEENMLLDNIANIVKKHLNELSPDVYRDAANKREAQFKQFPTSLLRKMMTKKNLNAPKDLRLHADRIQIDNDMQYEQSMSEYIDIHDRIKNQFLYEISKLSTVEKRSIITSILQTYISEKTYYDKDFNKFHKNSDKNEFIKNMYELIQDNDFTLNYIDDQIYVYYSKYSCKIGNQKLSKIINELINSYNVLLSSYDKKYSYIHYKLFDGPEDKKDKGKYIELKEELLNIYFNDNINLLTDDDIISILNYQSNINIFQYNKTKYIITDDISACELNKYFKYELITREDKYTIRYIVDSAEEYNNINLIYIYQDFNPDEFNKSNIYYDKYTCNFFCATKKQLDILLKNLSYDNYNIEYMYIIKI